jgi:hypothetical protein
MEAIFPPKHCVSFEVLHGVTSQTIKHFITTSVGKVAGYRLDSLPQDGSSDWLMQMHVEETKAIRRYATIRKIAGSSPDEVIGFLQFP